MTDDDMTPADAAWVRWKFENADTFNLDRLSFVAGYRRALEDAADAVAHVRDRGLPPGVASHPTHQYIENWLRDRAERVGTKDGDNQ